MIFYPKNAQKIEIFLKSTILKLDTSMVTQNDRNEILSNFNLLHFFPGCLEKSKNGKNVILYPKNAQKNRKIFEIIHFQATDLHDSSKSPQ